MVYKLFYGNLMFYNNVQYKLIKYKIRITDINLYIEY